MDFPRPWSPPALRAGETLQAEGMKRPSGNEGTPMHRPQPPYTLCGPSRGPPAESVQAEQGDTIAATGLLMLGQNLPQHKGRGTRVNAAHERPLKSEDNSQFYPGDMEGHGSRVLLKPDSVGTERRREKETLAGRQRQAVGSPGIGSSLPPDGRPPSTDQQGTWGSGRWDHLPTFYGTVNSPGPGNMRKKTSMMRGTDHQMVSANYPRPQEDAFPLFPSFMKTENQTGMARPGADVRGDQLQGCGVPQFSASLAQQITDTLYSETSPECKHTVDAATSPVQQRQHTPQVQEASSSSDIKSFSMGAARRGRRARRKKAGLDESQLLAASLREKRAEQRRQSRERLKQRSPELYREQLRAQAEAKRKKREEQKLAALAYQEAVAQSAACEDKAGVEALRGMDKEGEEAAREYSARLRAQAEAARIRRLNETPEQRKARNRATAEARRKRFLQETPEERKARLFLQAMKQRQYRENRKVSAMLFASGDDSTRDSSTSFSHQGTNTEWDRKETEERAWTEQYWPGQMQESSQQASASTALDSNTGQMPGQCFQQGQSGSFPLQAMHSRYMEGEILQEAGKSVCDAGGQHCLTPKTLGPHTHVHPGQCPVHGTSPHCFCGARFSVSHTLNYNLPDNRSGASSFLCEVCGCAFNHQLKLASHLRHHRGLSPYTCPVCGATFSHTATFQGHVRFHSGEKPYRCSVCQASFRLNTTLSIHMRTHANAEREHTCNKCRGTFKDWAKLRAHQRRWHTQQKLLRCSHCTAKFVACGALKNHTKEHRARKRHPFRAYQALLRNKQALSYQLKCCVKQQTGLSSSANPASGKRGCAGRGLVTVRVGNKPHMCYRCGVRFDLLGMLVAHKARWHCKGEECLLQHGAPRA